jgi:hypothetical protein
MKHQNWFAGLFVALAGMASASPLTWNLSNVTLGDGSTVTGSFVFDADTTTFSNLNLVSSGGAAAPASSPWAFNVNNLPGSEQNAGGITGFQAVDVASANETGAHYISLFSTGGPVMTNAGGTIVLTFFQIGTCGNANCSGNDGIHPVSFTGSGSFTTDVAGVPEPSTWMLSGSALLVGLLRRKRR